MFGTLMVGIIKEVKVGLPRKRRLLSPFQKAFSGAATGWKNFHVRGRLKSELQISFRGFYHRCKSENPPYSHL